MTIKPFFSMFMSITRSIVGNHEAADAYARISHRNLVEPGLFTRALSGCDSDLADVRCGVVDPEIITEFRYKLFGVFRGAGFYIHS